VSVSQSKSSTGLSGRTTEKLEHPCLLTLCFYDYISVGMINQVTISYTLPAPFFSLLLSDFLNSFRSHALQASPRDVCVVSLEDASYEDVSFSSPSSSDSSVSSGRPKGLSSQYKRIYHSDVLGSPRSGSKRLKPCAPVATYHVFRLASSVLCAFHGNLNILSSPTKPVHQD
jgi:hypothetical protein